MGLDNGSADRQSQPKTRALGREERFENALCLPRLESFSRILNLDSYHIRFPYRFDDKLAWLISRGAHGIDTVHYQVQQDLLQLHAVAKYGRQIRCQVELDGDAVSGRLIAHKISDFLNQLIDVQFNSVRSALFQQSTNA